MVEPAPETPAPESWIPEGLDLSRASVARMYDYYLGGAHNFAVDRELARQVVELYPSTPLVAQTNRAFLHRAVNHLVGQGVRQFIDIGAGIPTVGSVHETAQAQAPDSRVLYVDHDPVAVAHGELLLADQPNTRVLAADLREPAAILDSAERHAVIDLSQPVAVLMLAVLHFFALADQPEKLIGEFLAAVAPGSYLVISHVHIAHPQAKSEQVRDLYRNTTDPLTYRSREQILDLLRGWELIEPGLVWLPEWRPDWPDEVGDDPSASSFVGALGRKA